MEAKCFEFTVQIPPPKSSCIRPCVLIPKMIGKLNLIYIMNVHGLGVANNF